MSARTRNSSANTCPASWSWSSIRKARWPSVAAERCRAGGAGIPGFYTKTGVGTIIADGKEHKDFNGETYILETGLTADLAIVKAQVADTQGNLIYNKTARNFNPMMAMAGKVTIAEVEEIVPVGELNPPHPHPRRVRTAHHQRHPREAHRATDGAAKGERVMLVSARIIIVVTLLLSACGQAESQRAKQVVSSDFGGDWPLTVYSGTVNCIRNGHAVFIGGDGVYAMNGTAKNFADRYGYLDIREISKPHSQYPDVEADIQPLLVIALNMCEKN